MPLTERIPPDRVKFNFHDGQAKAWLSQKRVVAIIAGGRSGKTSFAPIWLYREMMAKGPGDYLVVGPNYPIIDKAAGPEIEAFFTGILQVGRLTRHPFQFQFSKEGAVKLWGRVPERPPRIIFGHADDPESLEAMSVKAAWLDEAGQGKFRLGSWEAVQQRVAIDQGRILITSKPYNLAWLKSLVYDPWEAAKRNHPDIDVVNFESIMNPIFPREEWDRAQATLPRWRFDMQYRGLFRRPAGLIYDCFDESTHKIPRFWFPETWHRYMGLDFGGVNTAAVYFAEEPGTKRLFVYREYLAGSRTAKEHVAAMREGEIMMPHCVGGSHSEGQWRAEFRAAGLPVREPPIKEVEIGIERVYALIKTGRLFIFDHCTRLLDEIMSYSRVLDDKGEPTEAIEDKASYHCADALRYLAAWYQKGPAKVMPGVGVPGPRMPGR